MHRNVESGFFWRLEYSDTFTGFQNMWMSNVPEETLYVQKYDLKKCHCRCKCSKDVKNFLKREGHLLYGTHSYWTSKYLYVPGQGSGKTSGPATTAHWVRLLHLHEKEAETSADNIQMHKYKTPTHHISLKYKALSNKHTEAEKCKVIYAEIRCIISSFKITTFPLRLKSPLCLRAL